MLSRTRLRNPVGPQDHAQGREEAEITLVVYGDYECPYSARAEKAIEALRKNFDLRIIFRHFPLTDLHPNALAAARAAEAADLQGRFWEMHRALFRRRRDLSSDGLRQAAESAELDLARFGEDFSSLRTEQRVWSQQEGGIKSGVHGTPTFFVNGFRHEGPSSYDALEESLRGVMSRRTA